MNNEERRAPDLGGADKVMGKIYTSMEEMIGKTPLMEIQRIEKEENLKARILVKLELFNPAGSIKDRAALSMLLDAEKRGLIKPGDTIIEPTSGNTGIGLAAAAASRGYKAIFTMPETMSVERRKLLAGYGARIVLTEGAKGMRGAIEKADELASTMEGAIVLGQFVNPANPKAHMETTGPEIWEDTDGKIDILVAGVGTGGTITGTGAYLKGKNPDIRQILRYFPAVCRDLTVCRESERDLFRIYWIQKSMMKL